MEHQQILWTNIGEISHRLPVIGPILDHLISQGAITADEYQQVRYVSQVPSQKARKLVEILASKGRREFDVFAESLKTTNPDLLKTIMAAPVQADVTTRTSTEAASQRYHFVFDTIMSLPQTATVAAPPGASCQPLQAIGAGPAAGTEPDIVELREVQKLATRLLGIQFMEAENEAEEAARLGRVRYYERQLKVDRFENFANNTDYSIKYANLDVIMERGRSVCKIEWPGGNATGFLIGRRYVLTNNHVFELMDAATKRNISANKKSENYRVTFFLSDTQTNMVFNIVPRKPISSDKALDYAILEIDTGKYGANDLEHLRPLGEFISEDLARGSVIVLIGHPCGLEKKVEFCAVEGVDNSSTICVNFGNPFVQPQTMTYHVSTFFHGSSGSPGFDKDGYLVLMHCRGFYPYQSAQSAIEQGVLLSSVKAHAKLVLPTDKFLEIFPEMEPGFSFK
ncbi:PREDICTED: protein FAM111A-like [Branchiostoma belcheri]|uniref:Protein FAM111A-like n=1 Tax=Branchiostoma belcheri TaxID=7741 RepID=A0A6P4Z051_BRABE|nr:PREDICTED: protein FAM111A-like [Branchiostoma belcheri]